MDQDQPSLKLADFLCLVDRHMQLPVSHMEASSLEAQNKLSEIELAAPLS